MQRAGLCRPFRGTDGTAPCCFSFSLARFFPVCNSVKFRNGIPGRFARLAKGKSDCVSVLLNPTLIDSRPSNSIATSPEELTSQRPDQITLQLRYVNPDDATVGVLPLADYLVLG
jgi:hypothetical protein